MKIASRPEWDFFAGVPIILGAAFLPWAQGGNHDSTPTLLACTVGLGVILWTTGLLFRRSLPQIPFFLYPCLIAIFVAGYKGLNNGTLPENPFILDHQMAVAERWPGGWIVGSSRGWFITSGICLLGLAAGTDILRRNRGWVLPSVIILLIGATVTAAAGLLSGGAAQWMFRDGTDLPGQFFAGFFHYSIAGAYLNMVWPLGFALAVARGRSGRGGPQRFGSLIAAGSAALAFAAIWSLPTIAAKGLSLGLLAILALAWAESEKGGFRNFWSRACEHYGNRRTSAALLGAIFLFTLFIGLTVVRPTLQNWGSVSATMPVIERQEPLKNRGDLMLTSEDPRRVLPQFERRLAWSTALLMLPEADLFGSGPRTWKARYPEYTDDLFLLTFFLHIQFAHNDFFQYLIEWGWLGGGAWIALWLLILWKGLMLFWRLLSGQGAWTRREWIALAAWLGIGSCLVHAQVDFPLQSAGVLAPIIICAAIVLSKSETGNIDTRKK
jgi:hypothetical protein